jgi:hypothetical protein
MLKKCTAFLAEIRGAEAKCAARKLNTRFLAKVCGAAMKNAAAKRKYKMRSLLNKIL